jgi:hypothetical protein
MVAENIDNPFLKDVFLAHGATVNDRQCSVDENYFSVIDSERKAYWLGLIWTDGCICIRNNGLRNSDYNLSLSLQNQDRSILEELKKDLKSTFLLLPHGRNKNYTLFTVYSKKLIQDLQSLGCHARKSLTIKPPIIEDNLRRHFWRGAIDGDGTLGLLPGGIHFFDYCGSLYMVLGFRNFVGQETRLYRKIQQKGNIYKVSYRRLALIKQICFILYSNSEISIKRKRNSALVLLNSILTINKAVSHKTFISKEEALQEEEILLSSLVG